MVSLLCVFVVEICVMCQRKKGKKEAKNVKIMTPGSECAYIREYSRKDCTKKLPVSTISNSKRKRTTNNNTIIHNYSTTDYFRSLVIKLAIIIIINQDYYISII